MVYLVCCNMLMQWHQQFFFKTKSKMFSSFSVHIWHLDGSAICQFSSHIWPLQSRACVPKCCVEKTLGELKMEQSSGWISAVFFFFFWQFHAYISVCCQTDYHAQTQIFTSLHILLQQERVKLVGILIILWLRSMKYSFNIIFHFLSAYLQQPIWGQL